MGACLTLLLCIVRLLASACAVVLFGAYAIHIRYRPFLEHSKAESFDVQTSSAAYGVESVVIQYVSLCPGFEGRTVLNLGQLEGQE